MQAPHHGKGSSDVQQRVSSIVDHILLHKPGLTRREVLEMIEERVKELEGLIDEDAAALLIARELGVPLPQPPAPGRMRLPLKDLIPGLQNVRVVGRVLKVFDWKFQDGRTMVKLTIADDSACVDCVAWGESAERLAREVKPGICVAINRASVVRYKGRTEVKIREDSSVERVEDPTIPPLEKLAEIYGVNIIKVVVHEVVAGRNGLSVYGIRAGDPACVLIPSSLTAPQIRRGDVLLVQEPRRLAGSIARYRLSRASRVFIDGSVEIDASVFRIVDLDEAGETSPQVLGVKGLYAASVPSKLQKGVILRVCGRRTSASILTFDEGVVNELRRVKPGTPIELTGVYPTPGGFRLNPFYHLRMLNERPQLASADNLSTVGCYVRTQATVLSASFRYRIMEDGEPLIGAIINLDDGTGYARAVISYNSHVETLLGASWDDIREQSMLGVLPELLSYVEDEMRGVDVKLEGFLSGDRTLAVEDLKL